MPFEDACLTLIRAKEREVEEKLFTRWLLGYQFEMSFEEFKRRLTEKKKPTEEILKEVNGYIEQFNIGFKKAEFINGNI